MYVQYARQTQVFTRHIFVSLQPVLDVETFLQAVFSACAKMCVRELRKTDTANVSVFYLSLCSTVGASIGLSITMMWGSGQGLMLPHAWDWALFAGIGMACASGHCNFAAASTVVLFLLVFHWQPAE